MFCKSLGREICSKICLLFFQLQSPYPAPSAKGIKRNLNLDLSFSSSSLILARPSDDRTDGRGRFDRPSPLLDLFPKTELKLMEGRGGQGRTSSNSGEKFSWLCEKHAAFLFSLFSTSCGNWFQSRSITSGKEKYCEGENLQCAS